MQPKLRYYILSSAWTGFVLLLTGAILNLLRNVIYDVPLFPLSSGLVVLIIFSIVAAGMVGIGILRGLLSSFSKGTDVEG